MMRIKDLFPDASGSGRVLVLGELLLDFVPCDSDMRLSQPGTVLKTVSGSSGIYACAAAGFGLDCSFIGKVGSDPFSQLALSAIASRGVRTDAVVHSDSGQLGLAFLEYLPTAGIIHIIATAPSAVSCVPKSCRRRPLPARRSCICRACCLS